MSANPTESRKGALPALMLGAIGVVFGDIGTSPLYTMKEVFGGGHLTVSEAHVLGILSLIFWSLVLVVSLKYVGVMMRGPCPGTVHEGEGMSLWREHLFAVMARGAASSMSFFRIPPNRVIEMGTQLEI
jgi:K+ transporter